MNLFIVGAGFTKAVFPHAPLNADLLDALATKNANSSASELRDRYKTKDIEIALTRLDTDIASLEAASMPNCQLHVSSRTDLLNLRKRIESELGGFFGISDMLGDASQSQFCVPGNLLTENPWLAQLIDNTFHPGDVAISLNYDCVLEGSLDLGGKWSPNGGYGSLNLGSFYNDEPVSPVRVVKIHGSASFKIDQDEAGVDLVGHVFHPCFFPRSAKNKHFDYGRGAARTYLIAPSYIKIPTADITDLMVDSLQASDDAENLIVIGSSLRPEDGFLTLLLANFCRQPSWRKRRIIIVDRKAEEISQRLRIFWGSPLTSFLHPIQGNLRDSVTELGSLLQG